MDLEKLLANATQNESGFEEIYNLTINRLFSFVLLRTKNKEEALDICQETYLSFFKSLQRFKYSSDAEFYAFFFQVARRQIIKARIKKRESVEFDEIFDIEAPESEKEDYRFLLRQVARLNDNERACVELRYFGDMTFAQIAENLGIKENNAKVLHHRAIKKLKEYLLNYE